MKNDIGISLLVEQLCDPESYEQVLHHSMSDAPMPSVETLAEIVELLRGVLFPGYFGPSEITPDTLRYYVGSTLDRVKRLLAEQVSRGYCFVCEREGLPCEQCDEKSHALAESFLAELPAIRRLLAKDVQAAFVGDPAAKTPAEIIFCYPSIKAMTNHRIAHALHKLGVEVIPRIIGELAHSVTGIDIHPGAQIGESFFIDHGTGTVIGETCIIGKNVRIYQGVTLGAKSFPTDERNRIIKGLARHPIVEDDVVVYAGATILGRVTIGKGAVIGGNVWITRDVPAGVQVLQGLRSETLVAEAATDM